MSVVEMACGSHWQNAVSFRVIAVVVGVIVVVCHHHQLDVAVPVAPYRGLSMDYVTR
jgi:hypothetical protein